MINLEKSMRVGRRFTPAFLFVIAACTGSALAQPPSDGANKNGRRGPPPEAVAACKSLSSGATCNFTVRETEKGTCWAPEGKPLACRPNDAPTRDDRGGSRPSH